MRAELKSLYFEPDPSTMPSEPAKFSTTARMMVGPLGSEGEESFDVIICSAEWLRDASRGAGGIYDARHHVVVDVEQFDQRRVRAWLAERVRQAEAPTWHEVGERLSRLGYWEFEDYRP